jgi:dienelactone hydrolase
MADIVFFHHALGLTDGVRAFADRLRAAGHRVTLPDLYDGATFATIDEGVAHAESIGFEQLSSRGAAAVAEAPAELVYAGISLGALRAQQLGQTRPGARAVLLYEGGVPLGAFGGAWPEGVPLQIHAKQGDPWAEVDVLSGLATAVPGAELHRYPGSDHLFTDASLDVHDGQAFDVVIERTLGLLERLG